MRTDNILTKEYLITLFSYRDGNLYWKNARKGILKSSLAGTKSHHYHQICIDYKIYRTHRLIWIYHNGNTNLIIDHINGNTFDNRIENLRSCTQSENLFNSKIHKNNKSGVKGICWDKQKNKWRARLVILNKEHHVGFFDDIESAKLSIFHARNKLHGNFAKSD